jgi:hypothetical protein
MTVEEKIEKAAEEAEDLLELAEDLGIISEEEEKRYKALLKKALPALLVAVPLFVVLIQ